MPRPEQIPGTGRPGQLRAAARTRPGLAEPATGHRWHWRILADLDGNEFCVLQPPDQRQKRTFAPKVAMYKYTVQAII
jgi:hypothetical protein